ncbi:MAG TPA: FG-GAP-like repeat-containing protein [Blastocatellia bacterium]|nr:FG-GAP-like repeat-containing protein [Blastocatellia bacterium]
MRPIRKETEISYAFCFLPSAFCLLLSASVLAAAGLFVVYARPSGEQNAAVQPSREEAYRANNIGVALLEQFNYKQAAAEFRRALTIEPSLALARVNLGIALYNLPDADGALRELKTGAEVLPDSPQAHYMLGLIARSQNRAVDGIAEFQRTLQIDPRDPGANINLGQLYMQQRKYPEAIAVFRAALAGEPYNVTATYNLAMALTRSGERQEGQSMMQKFQVLRTKGYATTLGQSYLEQGRYAEAIASTGAEPGLVDPAKPDVTFTDATSTVLPKIETEPRTSSRSPIGQSYKAGEISEQVKLQIVGALAGGTAPLDFDVDGDMDLFAVGGRWLALYRNDGGKLVDVTGQSGIPRSAANAITAVGGDYDNDGRPDIVLLSYGRLTLYHNDGNGKFSDRTAAADIPAYPHLALSAALTDVDHDGDLDIFIPGFVDLTKPLGDPSRSFAFPLDFPAAPNLLLRNNGDGKFTDITSAALVAGTGGHAVAVTPTDFDNHRDIDLLVANFGAAPTLYSNQRDGTFRDVAGEVGLNTKGGTTAVAAGDVNKDDFTDFFFGRADGPGVFAISDGKGRFVATSAPAGSEGPIAAQFLDYDNDGLLDLVLLQNQGARILRNLGTKWDDVTERAFSSDPLKTASTNASAPHGFASADIDGDGDVDLIVFLSTGDLRIARNDGGNRNRSLKVQLTGKASNRSAVGTKIEARAGSLKQKLETYAASPAPAPAEIIFGLGKRAGPDTVRLLWPAGIVQAETEFAGAKSELLKVTEIDRKPSSCPYLYTWNGERFEFVTDFMGGGEMGYWEAPGVRNHPDPDEYVRIRDDQLRVRDGRYELRVTNELEEALYVDHLRLIAIDHPSDTEVYPNEGMTSPPRRFKLFTTRGARAPLSAVDDHGHDVTDRIAKLDRRYPDDFELQKIRGYANRHTLTLDLGEPSSGRTLLLLTGWTDYAFSSDNVAASHSGSSLSPPELQVKDSQGRWQTAIADVGIPVGRPQTIVLDLSGKFPTRHREVRLVTNMRIYWDQILVDTSSANVNTGMVSLDPVSADLHWRGFSAEMSPDGREPFSYDYSQVSPMSPWKTMPGRYTREGDVRELLRNSDDRFVISRPGDEISISFDATRLRPLRKGWRRTFLLYADGFSKEMDINSASPDQVAPLPFHKMKSYPYFEKDSYPLTRRQRAYIARYNTRIVRNELPSIDAIVARKSRETGASSRQR